MNVMKVLLVVKEMKKNLHERDEGPFGSERDEEEPS